MIKSPVSLKINFFQIVTYQFKKSFVKLLLQKKENKEAMTKATMKNPNLQPVDVDCSDIFDPNHPDADWSGFVAKRSCRKHISSQPDQLVPAIDGTNFGPSDHVQTADWSKPARRIVKHRESGAATTDTDIEPNFENEIGTRSSTFSLIGGPVPANSPSNFSPKCWETEAQAAARKMKTDLQQLTNKGRSIHVRGRKRRTITSENIRQHGYSQEDGNIERNERKVNLHDSHDPRDLIGFRAKFTSCTDPAFLKEIGDAVSAALPDISPCLSGVATAPYATDGNLPTDPYRSASGERRKDLLLENFSSVVPGYTGKRTFIS